LSQNNKGNFFRYVQVTTTFGVTTALRIYILGVLVGGWVDKKLDSSPWFMLLGILLAIFLSFKFLLEQLSKIQEDNLTKEEK